MGRSNTINKDLENQIRLYLFGQLQGADEESLEFRLLTEPAFVEEFDTIVDEVTDQYVRNELADTERKGFEKSYLTTPEGRQKVRFTSELLERADSVRGPTPVVRPSGFFDRASAFWQVHSMRLVATAAAVVIIAIGAFLIWPSGSTNYAMLNLSISTANRAEVVAPAKVKLESGVSGVEVNLAIPEQARGARDYRVLLVGDGLEHDLTIDKRDDQTVTAKIPTSYLPRGTYAIQTFIVASDGTETRMPGNYYFNVE